MERFTPTAKQTLSRAQELAEEYNSKLIIPEFMLLAMTYVEGSDALNTLSEYDIITSKLRPFLETTTFANIKPSDTSQLDLSSDLKAILELSLDSMLRQGLHLVGTSHLLIGMMRYDLENVDKILVHFDVQRNEILKRAEFYAMKNDTLETQEEQAYLTQLDNESEGCINSILNMIGLNDDR